MTKSPILWGAGLACALGGAVAGTALGSAPVLDRSFLGTYYQAHNDGAMDSREVRALPDHYPLVTRSGTVPVEQLSERGLFSQARYRSFFAMADSAPVEFDEARYEPEPEPPTDEALSIGDPPRAPALDETRAEPLALAAGPASVTAVGEAKAVDVAAALAMR